MSEVDWSKAPEWADKLMLSEYGDAFWCNDEKYVMSSRPAAVRLFSSIESECAHSLDSFKLVETRPDAWQEGEKRMDNIAQNGNDGHYERKVVEHDKKNKYSRKIKTISLGNVDHAIYADVYDVLTAFEVVNPAMAHAVKKMLAPGQRGAKGTIQDMKEAVESIERAIELEAGDNDK